MSKDEVSQERKPLSRKFLGPLDELPRGLRAYMRFSRWADRNLERLQDKYLHWLNKEDGMDKKRKKTLIEVAVVVVLVIMVGLLLPFSSGEFRSELAARLGSSPGGALDAMGAGFSNAGGAIGGFSPPTALLIIGGLVLLSVGGLVIVATPAHRRAKRAAEAAKAEEADEVG